MRSNTRR